MNQPSIPSVGGVYGGSGATTVAAIIGADDAHRIERGQAVSVIVGRSTVRDVVRVTDWAAAMPHPPVVVIDDDCGSRPPAAVRDRLRILAPHVPALVRLPWCPPLRELAEPAQKLRDALFESPRPQWVRDIYECRTELVAALTDQMTQAEIASREEPPPIPHWATTLAT